MPQLDVSDILLDPDFVDRTLVATRNTQTVGDNGLAANSSQAFPFYGVVTNDKGDLLRRRAEGEHIEGSINIYTRFRLTNGKGDISADVVSWQGSSYTVSAVSDYSTYGRGFVSATCDLIPLSG